MTDTAQGNIIYRNQENSCGRLAESRATDSEGACLFVRSVSSRAFIHSLSTYRICKSSSAQVVETGNTHPGKGDK